MTKRILIVEDDPLLAMEYETEFLSAGYCVIGPVGDVQQALDKAQNNRIDFALLDYNLGCETSAPVARVLDEKGVKFVYVSCNAKQIRESCDLPAAPVLSKPVCPNTILKYAKQVA